MCSNQRRRRLAEMTAGGRSNILDPARRCRLDFLINTTCFFVLVGTLSL